MVSTEVPDITTAGFKEFVDFANRLPRIKATALHCHPGVVVALREAAPPPDYAPLRPPPDFNAIELLVRAEFEPGAWEIHEDGEIINSGKLA